MFIFKYIFFIQLGHGTAVWTSSLDMRHWHAEWKAKWTCMNDMHDGQSASTSSMDMQHGQAAWTSSMNMHHGDIVLDLEASVAMSS
jgi:hypothetical protein